MGSNHGPRQMRIRRHGVRLVPLMDFYHRMMRVSWGMFFLYILIIFLLFNGVFAFLYSAFCEGGIENIPVHDYWKYYFFSVQTSASIGYGFFHPITDYANFLVTIEAFGGLLMNALITGLVFARFSRPSARIIFSKKIIHVNYFGRKALMVRLGNARTNRIYSGKAKWVFLNDQRTPEGDKFRRMLDLKLVRDETSVFALSWTLIHVIDDDSPLKGFSFEDIHSMDAEFMVTFSGSDEETSQTLSTHGIYWARDVTHAKKYVDMVLLKEDGLREIDFSKIDLVEE